MLEKSELLKNNTWHEEINKRLQDDKYKNRKARIEFEKNANEIILTIKDEGNGFDWRSFVEMSTERAYDSHGRGIAMAGMISFDSLEYIGEGNTEKQSRQEAAYDQTGVPEFSPGGIVDLFSKFEWDCPNYQTEQDEHQS